MIKVLISGINGKMGQILSGCIAEDENMVVVAGIDKMPDARQNPFPVYETFSRVIESVDVVIDFSRPEALPDILAFSSKKKYSSRACHDRIFGSG